MRRSSTVLLILLVGFAWLGQQAGATAADRETAFARRQLEQMCEDRPDMAGILEPDDPVYRWVESCIDIGDPARRIYWIPLEPTAGFGAQNEAMSLSNFAQIRVSNNDGLTGEDRWLCLIFELHNIDNGRAYHKLSNAVCDGTLTADDYATEALLLELAAEVRTKKLLQRLVPQSHKLACSQAYTHYMSLPNEAPEKVSNSDRQRCANNLKHYRDWAKDVVQLRASYGAK